MLQLFISDCILATSILASQDDPTKMLYKRLKITFLHDDSVELSVLSHEMKTTGLYMFHQTLPIPIKTKLINAKNFKFEATFFLYGLQEDGELTHLGKGSLKTKVFHDAIAKQIVFHNDRGNDEVIGNANITVFWTHSDIAIGDIPMQKGVNLKSSHLKDTAKNKSKEYSFLLSRRLRHGPNTAMKERPVTYDPFVEKSVDSDAKWYVETIASKKKAKAKKSSAHFTMPLSRHITKATHKTPAKLRDTVMSVGFIHNQWPDPNKFRVEKKKLSLQLTAERRAKLLRDIATEMQRKKANRAPEFYYEVPSRVRASKEIRLDKILSRQKREVHDLAAELARLKLENALRGSPASPPTTTKPSLKEVNHSVLADRLIDSFEVKRSPGKPNDNNTSPFAYSPRNTHTKTNTLFHSRHTAIKKRKKQQAAQNTQYMANTFNSRDRILAAKKAKPLLEKKPAKKVFVPLLSSQSLPAVSLHKKKTKLRKTSSVIKPKKIESYEHFKQSSGKKPKLSEKESLKKSTGYLEDIEDNDDFEQLYSQRLAFDNRGLNESVSTAFLMDELNDIISKQALSDGDSEDRQWIRELTAKQTPSYALDKSDSDHDEEDGRLSTAHLAVSEAAENVKDVSGEEAKSTHSTPMKNDTKPIVDNGKAVVGRSPKTLSTNQRILQQFEKNKKYQQRDEPNDSDNDKLGTYDKVNFTVTQDKHTKHSGVSSDKIISQFEKNRKYSAANNTSNGSEEKQQHDTPGRKVRKAANQDVKEQLKERFDEIEGAIGSLEERVRVKERTLHDTMAGKKPKHKNTKTTKAKAIEDSDSDSDQIRLTPTSSADEADSLT